MSKKEFVEIVTLLRGAYFRNELLKNVAEADVWYECLRDLEFEWTKKAIIQWVQENKFPPAISEIRDLAKKIEQCAYENGNAKIWQ